MRFFLLRLPVVFGLCLALLIAAPGGLGAQTAPLSGADLDHLFHDNFRIIRRVDLIPPEIMRCFWTDAEKAGGFKVRMADPGEPFQATCNISRPELPGRRLVFAGVSSCFAFIHYERGGIVHGWYVAYFSIDSRRKVTYIGTSFYQRAFKSLAELRQALTALRPGG